MIIMISRQMEKVQTKVLSRVILSEELRVVTN